MCDTCISRLVPPWDGPDIGATVKDRPSACVLVEEAGATAGAAVLVGRARSASIWLASILRKACSKRASEARGGTPADGLKGEERSKTV